MALPLRRQRNASATNTGNGLSSVRSCARVGFVVFTVVMAGWILLFTFMQPAIVGNKGHNGAKMSPQRTLPLRSSTSVLPTRPPVVRLLSVARATVDASNERSDSVVTCTALTDVRGNLGPASVVLTNGTDWLKDRWQAASDMHGTNIQGEHWVQLTWTMADEAASTKLDSLNLNGKKPAQMVITRIVLDGEAAYADQYDIQIRTESQVEGDKESTWQSIVSSPKHVKVETTTATSDASLPSSGGSASSTSSTTPTIHVIKAGQSPGVDSVTPLHVIHDIHLPSTAAPSTTFPFATLGGNQPEISLRLLIHKSATGWGVSLWQIQVYGWYL